MPGRFSCLLSDSSSDLGEVQPEALPGFNSLDAERMTGIEPALSAWEAEVLPLNYIRASRPPKPHGTVPAYQDLRL